MNILHGVELSGLTITTWLDQGIMPGQSTVMKHLAAVALPCSLEDGSTIVGYPSLKLVFEPL